MADIERTGLRAQQRDRERRERNLAAAAEARNEPHKKRTRTQIDAAVRVMKDHESQSFSVAGVTPQQALMLNAATTWEHEDFDDAPDTGARANVPISR